MKHPFLGTIGKAMCLATALLASAAQAQGPSWPQKPITVIVPFPAGLVDANVRLITTRVAAILGQPLVIDNRPGAGQRIGTGALARAPKDGYTIGALTQAGLVVAPALLPTIAYDPAKDFSYLTMGYESAFVITTSPSSGIKNLRQLMNQAKASPGKYKFGSTGVGTGFHVWNEVFNHAAGIQLLHVPYKGEAGVLQDLVGNQIDMAFSSLSAKNLVDSGKLLALATTGDTRSAMFPETPTVKELGIPFSATTWLGFVTPAGVPAAVREKLTAAFHQAMLDPELVAKFEANGMLLRRISPAEFQAQVASETKWLKEIATQRSIHLE